MQVTVNLTAGIRARQLMGGRYLAVADTGAAESIELSIWSGNTELEHLRTAKRGTKARLPELRFSHIELVASVDTAVELIISEGLVDIDFSEGATVHIADLPLPVANNRGASIGAPVFVSGITYDDTPAASIDEAGPAAVTDAPAVFLAANVDRKGFRVVNMGPDDVAIGGPGLTWAKRVIVLGEAFGWEERDGGPLAWSAVCDTGNTATLNVQEVLL